MNGAVSHCVQRKTNIQLKTRQHVVTITCTTYTLQLTLFWHLIHACFCGLYKAFYRVFRLLLLAGMYRLQQTRMHYQQCVDVRTRNVKIWMFLTASVLVCTFFTCPNYIHQRENTFSGSVSSWKTQTEKRSSLLSQDKSGTPGQKRDKWASRETCDFFRDLRLKIGTVPVNPGQMVTLNPTVGTLPVYWVLFFTELAYNVLLRRSH